MSEAHRKRVLLALPGLLLFLAVGLGLGAWGIPPEHRWAGAVVVWMAAWWILEPVPLWVTACVPIITFPFLSGASFAGTILQYIDPVNFLFLGGMWIAASMEQWGLHRRIALNIVSAIGISPRRIVFGFMLATGFVTLWISNTAAAVMMFPIAMAVLKKFEEQQGRNDPLLCRFGLALMLGLGFAASIGGIGTKIGTGTNLVFVKLAHTYLPEGVDFLSWAMIGMPIVLLTLPLVWAYLVFIAAPLPAEGFAGAAETIRSERAKLGPMNDGEKIALTAFLSAGVLWIFRKELDFGSFQIAGWSDLIPWEWKDVLPLDRFPSYAQKLFVETGDAAVAMVIGVILLLCPVKGSGGQRALSIERAMGVQWGLLILLGGGFAMAFGLQSSGLTTVIANSISQMGRMDPLVVILIVAFIAVALTEVASNTATANILLPIIGATAAGMGLHPAPVMLAATMSASFGFMFPAGTPANAVVFSSGYITVRQMARTGLVVDLFGALLIAIICRYLAPVVLKLGDNFIAGGG